MSFEQNPHPTIRLRDRMLLPLAVVLLITIVGTSGYLWLGREHGANLVDAFYMTIITITTIGYGEVIPLDDAGRLFTALIAVTGVGAMFYTMTTVMDYLVMYRLADPQGLRKMQTQIEKIHHHIVIAGLGRVGRQAAQELQVAEVPFVIIDPRDDMLNFAIQHEYLMIKGDATDDTVLESAGIRHAKGLIVTSADDASNLYIVLSARALNPNLFIVSRAVDDSSVPKLMRAGANRAISPYAIGGRRLAHLIVNPTVIDFCDTIVSKGNESLSLEGIQLQENSRLAGQSLGQLREQNHSGANILAILRGEQVIPDPESTLILSPGDQILALGTSEQLHRLVALFGP
jgi:voltage-gated potassium channel